jgi:uncharacterized protein (TIGR00730 family)
VKNFEINDLAKEESWRMFRIMGEFVGGLDGLADIEPAVTIYGSARLKQDEELFTKTEEIAFRLGEAGFSIITGGGPGVMEAANKGALKAGVESVGLSIDLPSEQCTNDFTTRSIRFNHFFVRKVMLVKYATAFIIMPGGMGTLDELTEVITLMQTFKIRPFPVILFDSNYWRGLLEWLQQTVMARGFVSDNDMELLRVCDEPEEIAEVVRAWYMKHDIIGRRALR